MSALLAILFVIVWVTVAALLKGFVLSVLWSWFLVPLGLPQIGIVLAIGVSLTVHTLTTHDNATEEQAIGKIAIRTFVGPFVVLAIGWVVKQFL